jgi:hypothetical protein
MSTQFIQDVMPFCACVVISQVEKSKYPSCLDSHSLFLPSFDSSVNSAPNVVAECLEWLGLLLLIRETLGSNIGLKTDYSDMFFMVFLSFSRQSL